MSNRQRVGRARRTARSIETRQSRMRRAWIESESTAARCKMRDARAAALRCGGANREMKSNARELAVAACAGEGRDGRTASGDDANQRESGAHLQSWRTWACHSNARWRRRPLQRPTSRSARRLDWWSRLVSAPSGHGWPDPARVAPSVRSLVSVCITPRRSSHRTLAAGLGVCCQHWNVRVEQLRAAS